MKTPLKIIRKEYPRIRVRIKGNNTSYEVDCRSVRWTGQPYFSFPSKNDAIEKAQEVANAVVEFGMSGINHEDVKLLARCKRKLAPFHLGLDEAIDRFIQTQAHNVTMQKSKPINNVTAEYLTVKMAGLNRVLSEKSLIGIKTTCNALNKCFADRPIESITKEDVENSLVEHWENPASRKDYVIRFRTFFKWAMGKKYISKNPCGTKDKGDAIVIHSVKPETQKFCGWRGRTLDAGGPRVETS